MVAARIIRLYVSRTDDHLGSQCPEQIKLRLTLLVGGGKNTSVSLHGRRQRETHPCVSGCSLNDGTARSDQPPLLCIFQHFDSHPVLDTLPGIHILHLDQDGGLDRKSVV